MSEQQQQHHEPTVAPGQELTLHPTGPAPATPEEQRELAFVAVFQDSSAAQSCAEDLERRGLGVQVGLLALRGDAPSQGAQPAANTATQDASGAGGGQQTEGQSSAGDVGMGGAVSVGATIGATVGLLATTYGIPGVGPLLATGGLVTTLAGAGVGAFLGGLSDFAGREGRGNAAQPGRGGVLMLVRTQPQNAEQVRSLIERWHPVEIREQ